MVPVSAANHTHKGCRQRESELLTYAQLTSLDRAQVEKRGRGTGYAAYILG